MPGQNQIAWLNLTFTHYCELSNQYLQKNYIKMGVNLTIYKPYHFKNIAIVVLSSVKTTCGADTY